MKYLETRPVKTMKIINEYVQWDSIVGWVCFMAYQLNAKSCSHTHTHTRTLAERLECSPMARETRVQSLVDSYQRLKKWYLMPPCLTHSIRMYESRVKWSNPEKGVVPSPTPWCSSYRKGNLRVTLAIYIYIYIYYTYIYFVGYIFKRARAHLFAHG